MKQSILLITPNKSIYLHFYLAVYSHTPPRPLPDPLAELRHIERTDEWYIRECIETYWLPLCSKPRPPEVKGSSKDITAVSAMREFSRLTSFCISESIKLSNVVF